MGGSFGRRAEVDFVIQAVTVSKAIMKPVQIIWSREEDSQHGFYRPASMSRYQVDVGANEVPEKWESQTAQQNFMARMLPPLKWFNFDPMAVAGQVHDYGLFPAHFYEVEGVDAKHSSVEFGVPVGAWRSPPNSCLLYTSPSPRD